MDFGSILTLIVGGLVALTLILIGVHQIRKSKPVAFYTGEEPPVENKLRSVRGWNTGHGLLWIGYGTIILICYLTAVLVPMDYLVKTLLLFGGTVIPTVPLVLGHHYLIKKYLL